MTRITTARSSASCTWPASTPALALKWSADAGGHYDDQVNQAAAENVAETDTESALELLRACQAGRAQYVLQKLAERFAGEDREKAPKFAEEAAVQARAMEQPDRTGAMAKAGAVLARSDTRRPGLRWSTRPRRPPSGWARGPPGIRTRQRRGGARPVRCSSGACSSSR